MIKRITAVALLSIAYWTPVFALNTDMRFKELVAEKEPTTLVPGARFVQGELPIDWDKVKASITALSSRRASNFGTGGTTDEIDAIVWLGMAGDPAKSITDMVSLNREARVEPARGGDFSGRIGATIRGQAPLGAWKHNPDVIYINIDRINFPGSDDETLVHEFRHRGLAIARKVVGISLSKDEEHYMIYAKGGKFATAANTGDGKPNKQEIADWIREYDLINLKVQEYLRKHPIPAGGPEALRKELEKVYGKHVQVILPNQAPDSSTQIALVVDNPALA